MTKRSSVYGHVFFDCTLFFMKKHLSISTHELNHLSIIVDDYKGWFTLDRDVLWVVAIDHVHWFTYERTHRIRSQCIISDRNALYLIAMHYI